VRGLSLRTRLAASHALLAMALVALVAVRMEASSVAVRRAEAAARADRQAETLAHRVARLLAGPLRLEIGFGLALVALAGVGGWWLAGKIGRPLRELTVAAHHLALGDLTGALPRPAVREIATLAAAFDRLTRRLTRLSEERADQERHQQEALRRLAHSLRTPLAVLALRLEELAGPDLAESRRQELAAVLSRQVDNLAGATDHLADLASFTADLGRPERVDLGRALKQAVERIEPLASWSRLRVRIDPAPEPLIVSVERAALVDALANLLENAVKFTPAGGQVVARCRREGVGAAIEVEDTGPGIPTGERRSVIRPGMRGSTSAGIPGTGLGLALVAETAAAGGGRLELDDGREGGLLARLLLPIDSVDAAGGGETRREDGLVDDELHRPVPELHGHPNGTPAQSLQ
jgi:signal transduction histidine kinase